MTAVCPVDQGEQCKDDEGACSAYLSDEGLVKTAGTCVGGRCRCGSATDGDWDPCTCLRKYMYRAGGGV